MRPARDIIRLALQHAIIERDSFADANPRGSTERAEAEALAAEMRAYLLRRFGERPWQDVMFEEAGGKAINIFNVPVMSPKKFDPGKP